MIEGGCGGAAGPTGSPAAPSASAAVLVSEGQAALVESREGLATPEGVACAAAAVGGSGTGSVAASGSAALGRELSEASNRGSTMRSGAESESESESESGPRLESMEGRSQSGRGGARCALAGVEEPGVAGVLPAAGAVRGDRRGETPGGFVLPRRRGSGTPRMLPRCRREAAF